MKVCPVCQARAFDDAASCYGCLHRFTEDDHDVCEKVDWSEATAPLPAVAVSEAEGGRSGDLPGPPPGFCIRLTPTVESTGAVTWQCAVEADARAERAVAG